MNKPITFVAAMAMLAYAGGASAEGAKMNDAQIAHVAYTAGQIDVAAGQQALAKSKNATVRAFASEMVRDHTAVNDKALALVKKLHVTPQDNPTSMALSKNAANEFKTLASLEGAAFDRAYIRNEVAYHKAVNSALKGTLIPDASNSELKSLLQTGLTLFTEHQMHAEHLASEVH